MKFTNIYCGRFLFFVTCHLYMILGKVYNDISA